MAALAASAPAQADDRVGGPIVPGALGPVLAGDELIFTDSSATLGTPHDLFAIGANGTRRLVASADPADTGGVSELSASAQRIAYGSYQIATEQGDILRGHVFTGPPAGPFATLVDSPEIPVVSGDAVAIPSASAVVLYDFATGPSPAGQTIAAADAPITGFRFAGRYMAWGVGFAATKPTSPKRQIVVYDRLTGAEAYRVPASASLPITGEGITANFALQADGKVAIASPQPDVPVADADYEATLGACVQHVRVVWFEPGDPAAHVLPEAACSSNIAIAADRVVYLAPGAKTASARIVAAPLDGSAPANIGNLGGQGAGFGTLAFDGTRAAWALRRCDGTQLFARAVADTSPLAAAPSARCKLVISRRALRLSAANTIKVEIGCPAGCRSSATLFPPSHGPGAGHTSLDAPFRAARGGTATATFKVPQKLVKRWRGAGRWHVTVGADTGPQLVEPNVDFQDPNQNLDHGFATQFYKAKLALTG